MPEIMSEVSEREPLLSVILATDTLGRIATVLDSLAARSNASRRGTDSAIS